MKSLCALLVTAALLLSLSLPSFAFAQPAQISYTVTLNWFSLQVTYPSEVMPGEALNVSVQGTPKSSNIYLQSLTAAVYFADATGLHLVATQTLVSNPSYAYAYYGAAPTGSFSVSFTVSVPENASRTSLMGVFSETTQYSSYYPYYYYQPYPFAYWYYRNPLFYSFYPAYTTSTDQGISPLSYIEATTPEYVTLQSAYDMVQHQLNQTQTQNHQLQTTITQENATISQLNRQLTSANTTAQTYQAVAAVFAIIAVALAAFSIYQLRSKEKTQKTGKTKASKSEE